MKFFFIIQGEGRGHMTQAVSLSEILKKNGHDVVFTLIGKSRLRSIPRFIYDKIGPCIETIESPNFITSKNQKGIRVLKSIVVNLARSKVYFKSISTIHEKVLKYQPDAIINFCELLGGLYLNKYKPNINSFAVGHHYFFDHPVFSFPKGNRAHRWMLKLYNKLSAMGADKILALSMSQCDDIPSKKMFIVPPLIREDIKSLKPSKEDLLLGYMLNPGFYNDIVEWHKKNPTQKACFFWDKQNEPDNKEINSNLTFHQINDKKYLENLAKCKGLLCTAGFESVCEAMFLEKPVMVVPSGNHYEQKCNARDLTTNGGGIKSIKYNPEILMEYIPYHNKNYENYKKWVLQAEQKLIKYLTHD